MIVFSLLLPETILRICGVAVGKYPELQVHMYGYLKGCLIGVPALMVMAIHFRKKTVSSSFRRDRSA